MLYDRFSARAHRLAAGIAGEDRHGADAVVQEAFVALWRGRSHYEPELGSVAGWVMDAVRHAADAADADAADAGADAAEEEDAGGDGSAELRSALGRLPTAEREIIALAYFGELSSTEIAGRLSLPVGTVQGRMRLGLDELRDGTDR